MAIIALKVKDEQGQWASQPIGFDSYAQLVSWAIAQGREAGEAMDGTVVGTPNGRGGRTYRFDPNVETAAVTCRRCQGTGSYATYGECYTCQGRGALWVRPEYAESAGLLPATGEQLEALWALRPHLRPAPQEQEPLAAPARRTRRTRRNQEA